MENPYAAPAAELKNAGLREPSVMESVQAAFGTLSGPLLLVLIPLGIPSVLGDMWTAEVMEQGNWGRAALYTGASLPLDALIAATFFSAARHSFQGVAPSAGKLAREALEAWPRVFAAYVLSMLAMVAGLVLFILPGVYVGIRLSFSSAAAFEERISPTDALRASGKAAGGRFGKVFMLSLVFVALALVATTAIEIVLLASPDFSPLLVKVAEASLSLLLISMSSAAFWFYYRDILDARPIVEEPPSA